MNKQVLELELTGVMGLPRNKHTHPEFREMVGGYLYQKFGKCGLVVGMQNYRHELPIREYAEQFGETLVSLLNNVKMFEDERD